MEDILRMLYPTLEKANMKALLRPYCSSANKVLLDYKQLRDFILNGLKGILPAHSIKGEKQNRRFLTNGAKLLNPT